MAHHLVAAGGDLSALDVFGLVFAGDVEGAAGAGIEVLEAVFWRFQSVKSPAEMPLWKVWIFDQTTTSWSGSGYGMGARSVA